MSTAQGYVSRIHASVSVGTFLCLFLMIYVCRWGRPTKCRQSSRAHETHERLYVGTYIGTFMWIFHSVYAGELRPTNANRIVGGKEARELRTDVGASGSAFLWIFHQLNAGELRPTKCRLSSRAQGYTCTSDRCLYLLVNISSDPQSRSSRCTCLLFKWPTKHLTSHVTDLYGSKFYFYTESIS